MINFYSYNLGEQDVVTSQPCTSPLVNKSRRKNGFILSLSDSCHQSCWETELLPRLLLFCSPESLHELLSKARTELNTRERKIEE